MSKRPENVFKTQRDSIFGEQEGANSKSSFLQRLRSHCCDHFVKKEKYKYYWGNIRRYYLATVHVKRNSPAYLIIYQIQRQLMGQGIIYHNKSLFLILTFLNKIEVECANITLISIFSTIKERECSFRSNQLCSMRMFSKNSQNSQKNTCVGVSF